MKNEQNESAAELLSLIGQNIRKHGLTATIEKIRKMDKLAYSKEQEEVLSFILTICANSFGVKVEQIENSTERGDVVKARTMCFMLIKVHLDKSNVEVGELFGKTRQVVGRAVNRYKDRKQIILQEDIEFIEMYDQLSNRVKIYKNNKNKG